MDTEIEIKFFADAKSSKRLTAVLAKHKVVDTSVKQLHNVYFDTADNQLRDLDIGLRVRTCDEQSVQTLKTRGQVVGGLHLRPEYNVGIDSARPQLSLFPAKAWPEGVELEKLQRELTPLFTTHFERQAWLLSLGDDTLVEVALDMGNVEAKGGSEPICEIELEIVKGDIARLFELASEIAELGGVRQGNISKAQRGYRLAKGYQPYPPKTLDYVALGGASTLEDAFPAAIEAALNHWQYHEQLFFEAPSLISARQVLLGVQFFHQTMLFFSSAAPGILKSAWLTEMVWLENQLSWLEQGLILERILDNRGHFLRKLNNQKSLINHFRTVRESLPDHQALHTLFTSARYAGLVVAITRWFYSRGWQLDEDSRKALGGELSPFCRDLLEEGWQEIKSGFTVEADTSCEQLLAQKGQLQRNLMAGLCFGELYNDRMRDEFRHPWMDMIKGLEDLELIALIRELLPVMSQEERQHVDRWLQRKSDSLQEVMTLSLQQAVQMWPYWR